MATVTIPKTGLPGTTPVKVPLPGTVSLTNTASKPSLLQSLANAVKSQVPSNMVSTSSTSNLKSIPTTNTSMGLRATSPVNTPPKPVMLPTRDQAPQTLSSIANNAVSSIVPPNKTQTSTVNATPTQNWGVNSPASIQTNTYTPPVQQPTGTQQYTGYTSSTSPATVTTTPVDNNVDYSGTNQAQTQQNQAYLPTQQGQMNKPIDASNYGLVLQALAETGQMSPQELLLNQQIAESKARAAENAAKEGMAFDTTGYQSARAGLVNQAEQARQQNLAAQALTYQQQRQTGVDTLSKVLGATNIQMTPESTLVNLARNQASYGLGTVGNQGGGASTGANNYIAANNLRTNVATANAFAQQGTTIDGAIQNLQQIGGQANELLLKAGLNTKNSNWANDKINSFVTAQNNPAAYASLISLNNEVQ